MPELSQRGRNVPASPIRKLVPYAVAARERGTHVYHLNIGQPDIETPPAFMKAVRNFPAKVIAYEHSQGIVALIEAFREYYRKIGFELSAEEVQVTTGGSEAVMFALAAATNPGDRVVVFEPFYTNYAGFAAQLGIELTGLPTEAASGFHLPSRKAIEAAIDDRTRALIICNPNNPTGTVFTSDELVLLADLCKQHELFLIADEVYREFCYSGAHRSTLDLPGMDQHVIVVDSLSKRLSACGARVGALISHNPDVMAAALRMAQARLSSPTLEMTGAAAALMAPDTPAFIAETIDEYRRRRDVVLEGVRKIPGAMCETPNGAFYVMATLPVEDSDDFARWLLTDFERDESTVMVAPGAGFYVTPGKGKSEVRIAYVLNCDDLKIAMDLLGEAVAAYRGVVQSA